MRKSRVITVMVEVMTDKVVACPTPCAPPRHSNPKKQDIHRNHSTKDHALDHCIDSISIGRIKNLSALTYSIQPKPNSETAMTAAKKRVIAIEKVSSH